MSEQATAAVINAMRVTTAEVIPHIITCLKADRVPMIAGDPGIGKSEIVCQIADKFKLHVIDQRLSQCDPTDLNGFPMVGKDGKARYIPMDVFPMEDTPLPPGKDGFLVFLDELNSAPMAVQAASYKLILDRKVGQHALHPKTKIIGAGNLESNNAIVNRLSTAMQSRLIHLEVEPDVKAWLDWAAANNVDHRITSYINSRPENLHKFDPQHQDKTFACPRTWVFASDLIKHHNGNLKEILPLLSGTVSSGVAREFVTHMELCTSLPTIQEIMQAPSSIDVTMDPALLYAISHMTAHNLDDKNIPTLMLFINRLPVEFSTITLQTAIKKTPILMNTQEVRDWISQRGAELF